LDTVVNLANLPMNMTSVKNNLLLIIAVVCLLATCDQNVLADDPIGYAAGYRTIELQYKNREREQVTRQISLWYPTTEKDYQIDYRRPGKRTGQTADMAAGPHAVVLFSHGQWSTPEFSSFLTEELAEAGYMVAAVHHKDAVTEWKNHQPKLPDFIHPNTWDETKYKDRPEDMRALLDFLLLQNRKPKSLLHQMIDGKRIGAMGHSMGGYTVCGLVGGWKSWHDERIKAVLLLSPYILPYMQNQGVDRIQVPVMLHGATADIGITPFLPPMYKRLNSPKYFLVLKDENHFSWTNLVCKGEPTQKAVTEGTPELIVRYSKAFFDVHLQGQKSAFKALTNTDPELKEYQFEVQNISKK